MCRVVKLCYWNPGGQIPARLPRLALRRWKLSVTAEIPAPRGVQGSRTTHAVGSGYKRAVMTLPSCHLNDKF